MNQNNLYNQKHSKHLTINQPWKQKLFTCKNEPNCIKSFVCPCLVFYSIMKQVDRQFDNHYIPDVLKVFYCLFPLSSCLIRATYRKNMIMIYELEQLPNMYEQDCKDCCIHSLFPCCALYQEINEIKHQNETHYKALTKPIVEKMI